MTFETDSEIAFELTATEGKRKYFQRLMPADEFAYTSRFTDVESTNALICSIGTNPEKDRLMRAISHYAEALRNWGMGNELRTLCQLFLGIESLKTASWRFEAKRLNLSKEGLANLWGYQNSGRLSLDAFVDTYARLHLVFKNDAELHKAAKAVSDSFEHGYDNFPALYQPAGQALVKTAQKLREEIIRVSGLDSEISAKLLSSEYARPRGKTGIETYVRATLVGDNDEPAANGTIYPYLNWEYKIQSLDFNVESKQYNYRPNMTFTPSLAKDMVLADIKFEIWDSSVFMPDKNWKGAT